MNIAIEHCHTKFVSFPIEQGNFPLRHVNGKGLPEDPRLKEGHASLKVSVTVSTRSHLVFCSDPGAQHFSLKPMDMLRREESWKR